MAFTITSVSDLGNDVLEVKALTDEGEELVSHGWVSATMNHYDAVDYDAEGNRLPDAQPRAMTPAEVGEYGRSLIEADHFQPAAPEPKPVVFA